MAALAILFEKSWLTRYLSLAPIRQTYGCSHRTVQKVRFLHGLLSPLTSENDTWYNWGMKEEKLTQKWAVAAFFEDAPSGSEFPKEEVPLHATLAGVFAIDLKGIAIVELLKNCLHGFRQFTVEGAITEQWGDLKVTTIKYSDNFNKLYTVIQHTLLNAGAVFNEPQYLGAGFSPHVTFQRQGKLKPKQKKTVGSISLVDMFPDSDGDRRRIHTSIKLRENDQT